MTDAFEFAELIRDAARRVCRAENPCDAVTLRVDAVSPLTVRLAGVPLPAENVSVCAGAAERMTDGCLALALRAAGGQRCYIVDALSQEES
ncbi:MAG: hypothetical protein IK118_05330 [Clostridia bacterium]|nr:hypothetical protein [Clostridia bacterium]MBR5427750.1 hypothetical protein [Clostridia bacterium]